MVNDYEKQKNIFIGSNGRRITSGLFKETAHHDIEIVPTFSLKIWGKRYVEIGDPTGYAAAMELVGDWEHWNVLKNNPTLKPYFAQWDKELEIKLRSNAILSMVKHSKSDKGQASAKWLAEAGFKGQEKLDKRKKDNRKQLEDIENEVVSKVKGDMERLGIKVVGGGR